MLHTSHNDFCLSPIQMLWLIGHRSLVRTSVRRGSQILPTQNFWRGAPYGVCLVCVTLMYYVWNA